jgi:hypothetical protein
MRSLFSSQYGLGLDIYPTSRDADGGKFILPFKGRVLQSADGGAQEVLQSKTDQRVRGQADAAYKAPQRLPIIFGGLEDSMEVVGDSWVIERRYGFTALRPEGQPGWLPYSVVDVEKAAGLKYPPISPATFAMAHEAGHAALNSNEHTSQAGDLMAKGELHPTSINDETLAAFRKCYFCVY